MEFLANFPFYEDPLSWKALFWYRKLDEIWNMDSWVMDKNIIIVSNDKSTYTGIKPKFQPNF